MAQSKLLRPLAAAALAVALVPGLAAGSRVELGRARIEISLDRLVYLDGIYRATFEVHGECVRPDDEIDVDVSDCSGRPQASGTVGSAVLGFDARRTAELAPPDVPRTETSPAVADQTHSVYVALARPGDLVVEMKMRASGGVDPRPIDGSASEGGRIRGRSIVWRVDDASPGNFTFLARIEPNADQGFAGTFYPEVIVERRDHTDAAVEHFTGSSGSGAIRRVARLRLLQHVASTYGEPEISVSDAFGGVPRGGPRAAWAVSPAYNAEGSYQATVSGVVRKARGFPFERLAPEAVGRANTASMGYSFSGPLTGYKVIPSTGFRYEGRGKNLRLSGFVAGAETATPSNFHSSDQPLSGTLHDGDAGTFAITMSLGAVHAERGGLPSGPQGHLDHGWGGDLARGWTEQDDNPAPLLEPGATRAGPDSFQPSYTMEASFPAFATGGDVDNRGGEGPLRGRPVVIEAPAGNGYIVFIGSSAPPNSKYRIGSSFRGSRIRLVPEIRPGGYMLDGAGRGFHRDWAAWQSVGITTFGPSRSKDRSARRSFVFPNGFDNAVSVLDGAGRWHRFDVPGGTWLVDVSVGDVSIERLR